MSGTKTTNVPEMLRDAAGIYEERNKLYGDNYKRFGGIMLLLFPDGLELKTPDDFNRYGVFVQIVSKVSRYAEQFTKGGHPDSLDDNAVYSMMLQELDQGANGLTEADLPNGEEKTCNNCKHFGADKRCIKGLAPSAAMSSWEPKPKQIHVGPITDFIVGSPAHSEEKSCANCASFDDRIEKCCNPQQDNCSNNNLWEPRL